MNSKQFFYFLLFSFHCRITTAQSVYYLDASKVPPEIKSGYFKMGNPGPAGKQILINSRYITINGQPVIPVMGELQFSRTPKEEWEDRILKMKACGVNIVSTYLMWIHHEEIEGQFDWNGNKDFRSFLKLCHKHGMLVYPRIGPWVHGEVRNGGTPDWIMRKKYLVDRSNDPVYQQYVDRYYKQIGVQMEGLLYKDGGPVMGIQLENEYTQGKEGESHIMWLKNTALKYGMDVPMYSVTGWGDGSVPPNEVIPLWGGYPDEPWDFNIEKITGCGNFEFSTFRNDDKIGNNLPQRKNKYMDYSTDPYFTCEMGVGVENTAHRRLIINAIDGLGMITAKVGSGSNLLGYYIFCGGTNPIGTLTTMEEDKEETGYWSENTKLSYDFQAAVKESGELSPSYYEIKKFNYFLNEFGKELAPMEPVFAPKTGNMQYAVRTKDNSAFLFGINYCRNSVRPLRKEVQFNIKLANETLLFPSKAINIADSSIFIWPLNLDMDGTLLKYATVQPVCRLHQQDQNIWIFAEDAVALPELCFDASAIDKIESANGKIAKKSDRYIVTNLRPGLDCIISIVNKNGQQQKCIILSGEQSKHAWLLQNNDKKQFFISTDNMYINDGKLEVYGYNNNMQFSMLGNEDAALTMSGHFSEKSSIGLFTNYGYTVPGKFPSLQYRQIKTLDDAVWLKTSVKEVNKDNILYHKLFLKEFSLANPSNIKSAKIILAPEAYCRLQVNGIWIVNQQITSGKLNTIDITGYVNKGDNMFVLDFPFVQGDKAFAARVVIEYFNGDAIEFSTDQSWLTSEQYNFPSKLVNYKSTFVAPEQTTVRTDMNEQVIPGSSEWEVTIPCNYLDGLNNLYLSVNYIGNKARCRQQDRLVDDNFNSNTSWDINLKQFDSQLECRHLKYELFPLTTEDKILFDNPPKPGDLGTTGIKNIRFIPEYKIICNLK